MEEEKKQKKTGRWRKQVNFQLPPDVTGWVEEMERGTGMTRGRIGIAAVLGFILQTEYGQKYCLEMATAIDRKDATLDEIIAYTRVKSPGEIVTVGPLAEYLGRLRSVGGPKKIVWLKSAEAKKAFEERKKREDEERRRREVEFAAERCNEAFARLQAAGMLPSEAEEEKRRKKKSPQKN